MAINPQDYQDWVIEATWDDFYTLQQKGWLDRDEIRAILILKWPKVEIDGEEKSA